MTNVAYSSSGGVAHGNDGNGGSPLPPPPIQRLVDNAVGVVLGNRAETTVAVAALLYGGHVLFEDSPGVGKTLLAKALARSVGGSFGRIQGSVDLMPSDVTGVNVYDQGSGAWTFHPGPIFHQIVLVDELNRMSPRSQSALLEAMAEGQVTVDGETHRLSSGFRLIATQNPLEDAGTFPLSAAQLDRFCVALSLGRPDRDTERAVLAGAGGPEALEALGSVLTPDALDAERRIVAEVHVHEALVDYVLDVCTELRGRHGQFVISSRAAKMLLGVARAHARLAGRPHCRPDDVQVMAPAVLAHRLRGTSGEGLDELRGMVRAALDHVPAPPAPR